MHRIRSRIHSMDAQILQSAHISHNTTNMCYNVGEQEHIMQCKLGPREKGRKNKGRKNPQALRQARARRKALLRKLQGG